MRFYTGTLSGTSTLTISATDGVMFLSAKASPSSSFTVIGNQPFKSLAPASVTLDASEGLTLTALSPASPLDGLTLTNVTGTTDIIIGT